MIRAGLSEPGCSSRGFCDDLSLTRTHLASPLHPLDSHRGPGRNPRSSPWDCQSSSTSRIWTPLSQSARYPLQSTCITGAVPVPLRLCALWEGDDHVLRMESADNKNIWLGIRRRIPFYKLLFSYLQAAKRGRCPCLDGDRCSGHPGCQSAPHAGAGGASRRGAPPPPGTESYHGAADSGDGLHGCVYLVPRPWVACSPTEVRLWLSHRHA